MKSARFATLVERAGAPSPYLLWVPPEKDRTLQSAIKQHRVLTVHQDVRGTKKDYGTVGFTQEPEAQYLIFPKSLRRFESQRVVGINYDLLEPDARAVPQPVPTPAAVRPPKQQKPKPASRAPKTERPKSAKTAPARAERAEPAEPDEPKPPPDVVSEEPPAPPPLPEPTEIAKNLRRVLADLKAGKAVAAYERLQELLAALEPGSPPSASKQRRHVSR